MSERALRTDVSLFRHSKSTAPWLPVATLVIWWLICFGFYFTKWPISWAQTNFGLVCAMFLSSLIAMILGERLGSRSDVDTTIRDLEQANSRIPLIGLAILVALFIPMTQAYSGYGIGNLSDALSSQSDAYNQTTQLIMEGSGSRRVLLILQTLTAPLTLMALPYFALTWFQNRRNGRYFLLALALPLSMSVLTGRNQQLGITVLLTVAAWILSKIRQGQTINLRELRKAGLALAAILVVIAARLSDRTGGRISCMQGADNCTSGISHGTLWTYVTTALPNYASQGFEGLGRAFNGAWHFGGGVSHSPALSVFLGVEQQVTVTTQLDLHDWSSTGYWSTAFTGIANDVPWILVPVVIGVQAYLLGKSWRSATQLGDPLSTTVAALTWVSLFYTPQNLQLAISGPTYIGYLVLIFIYVLRGNAWKRANRPGSSLSPDRSPRRRPTHGW
jgi:hypothetical protein